MDEKELIIKIRNSSKSGQNRAEITRKLQQKGYKLEYIDELIKKSKGPSQIFWTIAIIFFSVLIISGVWFARFWIFPFEGQKQDLENPLKNFKINFGGRPVEETTSEDTTEIYLEEIDVTPEFFTYILNELGAHKLKKNPLTGNPPTINFNVEEKNFYSVVDNGIETEYGENENSDLTFSIEKEALVMAMVSENPVEVFKENVETGDIVVEQDKSENILLVKGYLSFYEELQ